MFVPHMHEEGMGIKMANSVNISCLKGLIKLLIVLVIIIVLIIVGIGMLKNSLTMEKLGFDDNVLLQGKTMDDLGLKDATISEYYAYIKTMMKNKNIDNPFNINNDKDIFAVSGIQQKLPQNNGVAEYKYLLTNAIRFNVNEEITFRDTEIGYLFSEIYKNSNMIDGTKLKGNIKEVTFVVAGGMPNMRVVFDVSELIDDINFKSWIVKPKNLYFSFYYSLAVTDGRLSAACKSLSINGLNNPFTEAIYKTVSIGGNKTMQEYGNLYGVAFCNVINNIGKVGKLGAENIPTYGKGGIEDGRITIITQV